MLTITFRNSEYRLRFKATLRIDALTMPPTVTYQRVRCCLRARQCSCTRLHGLLGTSRTHRCKPCSHRPRMRFFLPWRAPPPRRLTWICAQRAFPTAPLPTA